jgi:hypothetical protein
MVQAKTRSRVCARRRVYGIEIDSPAMAGAWTGRRRACVACSKL